MKGEGGPEIKKLPVRPPSDDISRLAQYSCYSRRSGKAAIITARAGDKCVLRPTEKTVMAVAMVTRQTRLGFRRVLASHDEYMR